MSINVTASLIPVGEELPEIETPVLVRCSTSDYFIANYDAIGGCWVDTWRGAPLLTVTHWAPLFVFENAINIQRCFPCP